MARQKHKGKFETCELCIDLASKMRNDLDKDAVTSEEYRRRHNAAQRRSEREDMLRACGLVKVRGALGGVYWE